MMKKKLLSLMLVLALAMCMVPTLTACSVNKSDISVLLMTNAQEESFYKKQFEAIGEELGIKIGFIGQASGNYYDTLRTEINAGSTPDIIYVRQSNIRQYLHDNLIADIGEYLDEYESTLGKIYPSARNMYKYDASAKKWGQGGTYAIPKDLSVQQLGYNKTLINQNRQVIYNEFAGDTEMPRNAADAAANPGQVKMPWEMDWTKENYTWDQYLRMAKALNSVNGVYGCDLPNIELLTWSFGGQFLSDDLQTVQLDSEAFKKAAAFQARLIDEGAASTGGATFEGFQAEKNTAFYGLVNSFDIKSFDESLGADGWDVMPWPYNPDTQEFDEWQGVITSAGYAVANSCSNKKLAVQVIMGLYTDAVQNKLVQQEKLMLPLFTDMAENFVNTEFDDTYSPKSRSVYIDVISGKNGRVSDSYLTYDMKWYNYIGTDYTDDIFKAKAGDAEGELKSDSGYTSFNSSVQKLYDDTKNN